MVLTNGVALASGQNIFQLCQNKQCSSKLNRISVITRENWKRNPLRHVEIGAELWMSLANHYVCTFKYGQLQYMLQCAPQKAQNPTSEQNQVSTFKQSENSSVITKHISTKNAKLSPTEMKSMLAKCGKLEDLKVLCNKAHRNYQIRLVMTILSNTW